MIYSPTVLLSVGGDLLRPGVLLVAVHGHLHAVHVGVLALDHVGQQAAGEGQELAEQRLPSSAQVKYCCSVVF